MNSGLKLFLIRITQALLVRCKNFTIAQQRFLIAFCIQFLNFELEIKQVVQYKHRIRNEKS